ncbi:MAG TPA: hypothetical protein VNK49_06730 [Anaerolineales bacterium]|nr:hypothetical protein [Anaerolineales bacterium]
MTILFTAHSLLRWLILFVAFTAVIKFALGWARGSSFKGMDRGLMAGFSGLMDLQATLGLILLLWDGFANVGFPGYRISHAVIMTFAAIVPHLSIRWKKADDKTRFRNNLFVIIGSLVLIFFGLRAVA